MKGAIERRGTVEEVRAQVSEEGGTIEGYAAVFDSESEEMGGFREIVRRSAFDRAIKQGQDVVARAHHKSEHLLGRLSSGTLKLSVDERGLKYTVQMPNTTAGRDTLELIRRGDIRHSSFAFRKMPGGTKWGQRSSDGLPLAELTDVDLVDVAPVIGPAYEATEVSARSLEEAKAEAVPEPTGVPKEINEARLRLAGL